MATTHGFPWKKEIHQNVGLTGVLGTSVFGGAYLLGSNRPSLTLTLKNFFIVSGLMLTGLLVNDYGEEKKWWPWLK